MLILVFLLGIAFALDNVPKTYTDPPIVLLALKQTNTNMAPVIHVLNTYTGPDPYICVYY